MRLYFTGILLCFSFFSIFGQITVGTRTIGPFRDFDKGEYEIIKKKTTLFVVKDLDLEQFKKMIQDVWTYNSYEVIAIEDYDIENYVGEKYAPFKVGGYVTEITSKSGMVSTRVKVYLKYFYFYLKNLKKQKFRERTIAAVFLSPDVETAGETIGSLTFQNLYEGYNNYSLGYLKNYFQKINKELVNEGYSWAYASDFNKKKLKSLKENTLFVPDYIKLKYNAWVFAENDRKDSNKLFEKYKYKYEWISKEDLSDKILNAKEDFYYLAYIRVNSEKFVNVVNGKTGEFIYRDYETFTYNIKRNDIKKLDSKIK